jgi:hypothetical protein
MKSLGIRLLNLTRRIVKRGRRKAADDWPRRVDFQGQSASNLIREKLLGADPCMITRIGHTELKTLIRYCNRQKQSFVRNIYDYVTGREEAFWFDDEIRFEMRHSSGFFPCTDEALSRFSERFLGDLTQADVLGSWLNGEAKLTSYLSQAQTVLLQDLEPYYHRDPWTTALAGRTVLVIHPFEATIRQQYEKRASLFGDQRMLPEFTLRTLRAVQSLGEDTMGFKSWFEALDWMCARLREIRFDVALIGAGAYGLPLAAYVKGLGRKAVHVGGATQIMFGIKGKRWDERPLFRSLYNEHWTRPLPEDSSTLTERLLVDGHQAYW